MLRLKSPKLLWVDLGGRMLLTIDAGTPVEFVEKDEAGVQLLYRLTDGIAAGATIVLYEGEVEEVIGGETDGD